MSDCIEQCFKDAYNEWTIAPIQPDKIDADRIPAKNFDNPMFQTFVAVPEELQSARHKAWKRYVVARERLLDFYCANRSL